MIATNRVELSYWHSYKDIGICKNLRLLIKTQAFGVFKGTGMSKSDEGRLCALDSGGCDIS